MIDDLDLSGIDRRHEPDPLFRAELEQRLAAIVTTTETSVPVIEIEPSSEMSISVSFDADSTAKPPMAPPSAQVPSRIPSGMSLKPALLVGALFVLVGVVIARWHELMQLLR